MPPPRARTPSAAQLAFRAAVTIGLGAEFGNQARWSTSSGMPFVANLEDLVLSPAFHGTDTGLILLNMSEQTALESADGDWAAMAPILAGTAATSLSDMTAAFNKHLWPSHNQASSRAKYWANWAVVVIWAIDCKAVGIILLMSTNTLKALSWELLCMGTPRSVIASIWSAIQNRHRTAGFTAPISGFGEFSAWTRCLTSLVGKPSALLFPVHRILVAAMLRIRPDSFRDNRDRLMVASRQFVVLRLLSW
jgi:hypothetical protein